MIKRVKCWKCGRIFEEKFIEWLSGQIAMLGCAKFICPSCSPKAIASNNVNIVERRLR